MADYTFIEMREWFYNNAPKIINEKYFLYVMGSIFLLGILQNGWRHLDMAE